MCYLYGIIASKNYISDLKEVIGSSEVWFERVGDFSDENFLIHTQAAMNANLQVLFIDLTCASDSSIIRGVNQYRMKRDSRIIIIAPNRQPGDETIASLISLQVLDFISFDVDEDEEEYERESISLLIKAQLNKKPTYGNVARWNLQYEQPTGKSKASEKPSKNDDVKIPKNPLDSTLMEHLESMLENEPQVSRQKEIIFTERIVGSVLIALGGVGRRTGTSHSAMRLSRYLSSLSYSVACVELLDNELNKPVFFTYNTEAPTKRSAEFGFHYEGIDFFTDVTMQEYIEIHAAGYQYLVVDMGQIVTRSENRNILGQYAQEFFRADLALITTTAAVWDFGNLVSYLDGLWENGWKKPMNILVNLCDDNSFKNLSTVFKKNEKKLLQIDFVQSSFQVNPFELTEDMSESYQRLLSEFLPKEKKKKKMFSKLFN